MDRPYIFMRLTGRTKPRATITNSILNGNFADGSTNWETSNMSFEEVGGIPTVTASASLGVIRQWFTVLENHKYYIRGYMKSDATTSGIYIELRSNSSGIAVTKYYSSASYGTYQILSNTATASTTESARISLLDAHASDWFPISVQYLYVVDLTAAFGAGQEPSAEEMDAILTANILPYFDGTRTVFLI